MYFFYFLNIKRRELCVRAYAHLNLS